jgi:riboflavin kinase/FMN adenylyltransferase
MQVIFLPFQNTEMLPDCALSIGNFDGVHYGHRELLKRLRKEADARNLRASLLTFEPHSKNPFNKPSRLSTLRDKLTLLSQTNMLDQVFVCRFTKEFAALHAQDFIDQILIKKLKTKYLLIGEDFRFGANRLGDIAHLTRQQQFATETMPMILIAGERVSSSLVRDALIKGDLDKANRLLVKPYQITGKVAYGRAFGKQLGFPTANIYLPYSKPVFEGVFIVEATGIFGKKYGVANLGKSPTVHYNCHYKLETYLFDYSSILYGQRLTVYFVKKLRAEKHFESIEALKAQIRQDVVQAKKYWELQ